jgi:hypothetical protein
MQAADEEETSATVGGVAQMGASLLGPIVSFFSDERTKENVRDGGSEADRRLDALMQTIKVGGDPLAAATNEDGRSGSAGSPRVFFTERRAMPQNSNPSVIRVPEMIIGSESPPMTERDREIAAAMGGDDAEALLRRREADRRSAQLLEALGQTDARVMQQLGMPERARPVRAATAADDQRARDLTAGLEELGAVTTRKLNASPRVQSTDERARLLSEGLEQLGRKTTRQLSAPSPVTYEYAPQAKAYGEGRQLGVMAQDMARSPELRPAVIETGDGLAVDGARAGYAALPLIGRLTERLEKLEKKGK